MAFFSSLDAVADPRYNLEPAGETEDDQLLKDPKMIERLKEIKGFEDQEKKQIYFTLDAVIREIKNRRTYAS